MTTAAAITIPSQPVPDRAARINEEHNHVLASVRSGLEHAINAGQLLMEVKADLPHGYWGPWIAKSCEFGERTARGYMRVAANRQRVAGLSLRDALKALSVPLSPAEDDSRSVHFSSESDAWNTPTRILAPVVDVLGSVDLDPCSDNIDHPNVPAAKHFTIEKNGLAQEWKGSVYLNPPYGRQIGTWVAKLIDEFEVGNVTEAVALLPARTDTDWCRQLRRNPRCFIAGRLRFGDGNNAAPFPSMAVYLGFRLDAFIREFCTLGDVYVLANAAEPGPNDEGPSR